MSRNFWFFLVFKLKSWKNQGSAAPAMASNSLESSLARESVGYLSKEEYKRKRETLEQEEKLQRMKAALAPPKEPPAPTASAAAKKKKKKKGAATGSLSFGDELDEGDDALAAPTAKKMGKCQDVDVSFLQLMSQIDSLGVLEVPRD